MSGDPIFMPDGESILFLAATGDPFDYDVFHEFANAGNDEADESNGYSYSLRVSPDGKTAAFVRQKWHDGQPGTSAIFLLDLASGTVTPLRVTGLE
jgi:hypothetical protein